jgi:hypothetical protein
MREIWWSRTGLTVESARSLYDVQEFADALTFWSIEAEERNSKGSGGGQDPEAVDAAFARLPRIERPPTAG